MLEKIYQEGQKQGNNLIRLQAKSAASVCTCSAKQAFSACDAHLWNEDLPDATAEHQTLPHLGTPKFDRTCWFVGLVTAAHTKRAESPILTNQNSSLCLSIAGALQQILALPDHVV